VNRLRWVGAALVAAAVLYLLLGLPHDGPAQEIQSAIHQGEANAHAQAAQDIPDHAAEVQELRDRADATQASLDRARAALARAEQRLAAQQGIPVPAAPGPGAAEPAPVAPDHRAEVIAAQAVLIEAQDTRIQALEGHVAGLDLALRDERTRSERFRLAYESECKATAAQAAATKAWKDAVVASKWRGRMEGFAAGAALGILGGRR
jgi:hypothetical protein